MSRKILSYRPVANKMQRRYVYINKELYKKVRSLKSQDIYIAQNCKTKKVQTFSYKVIHNTHEMAYSTPEVADMLGRSGRSVRAMMHDGYFRYVQRSSNPVSENPYAKIAQAKSEELGRPVTGHNLKNAGRASYYFTAKDIMDLRDVYATFTHGNIKRPVPTKEELNAILDQRVILYVKTKEGFVPTWQANEF